MTQPMDERNARIQRQHLERATYVYVRQSSQRQVIEHLESQRRQYDLVGWASTAGWPTERIVVIDEDQGKSASSTNANLWPYWGNHFWAKGYCVDTIGVDAKIIRKHVKYQEKQELRQQEMNFRK